MSIRKQAFSIGLRLIAVSLCGCSPEVAKTEHPAEPPSGIVIDVHTHFFDATDVPAWQFLHHYLKYGEQAPGRLGIAKGYAAAAYRAREECLDVAKVESGTVYNTISPPKRANGITRSIRFVQQSALCREQIALDYIRLHPEVALSMPIFIDLDGLVYKGVKRGRLHRKMRAERKSIKDRLSAHIKLAQDLTENDTLDHVAIPILGFNPQHAIAQEVFGCEGGPGKEMNICWEQGAGTSTPVGGKMDYEKSFEALVENGHVGGVKLYPPSGFHASDNCAIALSRCPSEKSGCLKGELPWGGFAAKDAQLFAEAIRKEKDEKTPLIGAGAECGEKAFIEKDPILSNQLAVAYYYDREIDKILEFAAAKEIPIVVHTSSSGAKTGFRYEEYVEDWLTHISHPEYDGMLAKPGLRLVLSHAGTLPMLEECKTKKCRHDSERYCKKNPESTGEECSVARNYKKSYWHIVRAILEASAHRTVDSTYPDVYADVSMQIPDDVNEFKKFVEALPHDVSERIMFGTDYWMTLREGRGDGAVVRDTIGISATHLNGPLSQSLYLGTAARVFGLTDGGRLHEYVCTATKNAGTPKKKALYKQLQCR